MTAFDRRIIGRYLTREVERRGSWSAFARTAGIHRVTLYRVRDADPTVTIRTLRQIEGALNLPFDLFASVGVHDWATVRRLGVREDVVTWLESQSVGGAPPTLQTRSTPDTGQASGEGPTGYR